MPRCKRCLDYHSTFTSNGACKCGGQLELEAKDWKTLNNSLLFRRWYNEYYTSHIRTKHSTELRTNDWG